nr:hypothetical protein [archaeon]
MTQKTSKGMKTKQAIMLAMLMILLSTFVAGDVSITNVDAPSSILEGEEIVIIFSAETDESETISYYILKDDVPVASVNEYDWLTGFNDAGEYEFLLIANTTNSTDTETRTIIINNQALEMAIITPEESTTNNSTASILVESDRAESCDYEIAGVGSGTLTKDETAYTKTLTLSEGTFDLTVNCSNYADTAEEEVSFTIDLSAPEITSLEPDNTYANALTTDSATLEVETNEESTCKYDISDTSYQSMDHTFSSTDSLNHYSTASNLNEGQNNYYVLCQDEAGNLMIESETIIFYANKKPTAEIDLEISSPLKAGTYEVTVSTSELVQSAPTLQYNFHNAAGKKTISLTGSGKSWEGFLIIDASTDDSVGTFYFSGTDVQGLTGTEIESGKLFLVDTTAPSSIGSFEVSQDGSHLKLEWYYANDDFKRFRIYKSTSSGVSYNDYYAATSSTVFEDSNVEAGVTYYYKVSVEDDAGNEGSLSIQGEGRVEPELQEVVPLSSSLTVKVDQEIKLVESSLLDVDWSISVLEKEKNADKIDVIEKLSLLDKIKTVKRNLELINKDLEKLK